MSTSSQYPSSGSLLCDAIQAEDILQVRSLLKEEADPSEMDQYGTSALMRAVFRGNIEIVNLLLDAGADPNYIYEQENINALSSAGRKDVLLAILRHEPHTDVKIHAIKQLLQKDFSTAFAKHIAKTLPEDMRTIHEHGIALVEAVRQPRPQPFEQVLQECQDATLAVYGGLVLTQCCDYTHPEYQLPRAQLLIARGADINGGDFPSPLLYAASQYHVALVEFLLEAGADPNVTDKDGVPPLGAAMGAFEMHADRRAAWARFDKKADRIAELLITAEADVNLTWSGGNRTNALMVATEWRPYNIRRLLEAGADARFVNADGRGPLHLCSLVSAAKHLKKHGADMHAQTRNGDTPLLLAARSGKVEMLKWLWGFAATRTARSKTGCSALHEARAMAAASQDDQYAQIITFLTQAGAE